HQQTLNVECPSDLPMLTSDPVALRRILAELLNNACKYTSPNNTIELNIHHHISLKDTNSGILFIVRNQAEIPANELPHLFEKFYRVPNGDPWSQGGTGLGLALVQRLIEQLQGSIRVVSQDGWTEFTVRLPVEPDSQPPESLESPQSAILSAEIVETASLRI
ncbi:MAG: ATP-binding protein, partial [Cyanothece sp. SIO1E1]|nr:ATP-binding protein [Cyanothece sp. SIO1E1]